MKECKKRKKGTKMFKNDTLFYNYYIVYMTVRGETYEDDT